MAIQAVTSASASVSDSESGANTSGSGSVVLTIGSSTKCLDLAVPAATSQLQLDFPPGVATAQFAFIKVVSGDDFTVQTSIAGGSTVFTVPQGGAMIFYSVDGMYISSANGGKVQFIVGG